MTTRYNLPRKVVVGTVIQGFWGSGLDLDGRIRVLLARVDELAAMAAERYPEHGLDLAVLPETAVTSGRDGGRAADAAVPLRGKVADAFGRAARKHSAHILVGMALADDPERGVYSNAAVLFNRRGEVAGIYRKVHPVAYIHHEDLEGGMTPGRTFDVFQCDFGRLGVQICWDMSFEDGWRALRQKGAEIVAWPTASPQTVMPACRAARHRYYIVSSTPADNATIFDPTGQVAAQAVPPQTALVHQIDLSFVVLHWSEQLRDGKAFEERFGNRVGYRYSRRENTGLFWSNDPHTSIGAMADELGLIEFDEHVEITRRIQDAVRGGPPEA